MLDSREDRLSGLIHSFSVYSPVKGLTNISAGQPQLDVARFVDRRVLYKLASNQPTWVGRKPTLTALRRTLVESNTALAGATVEILFARLRVLMAAFNEGRALFCPFGCWDLVVMVKTQGS